MLERAAQDEDDVARRQIIEDHDNRRRTIMNSSAHFMERPRTTYRRQSFMFTPTFAEFVALN